jgi:type II secretory pathway component GspD/PulD (secretin)
MRTKLVMAILAGACMAGVAAAQEEVDPRKQEILNKLNSQRISVDFKDIALDEAMNFVRDFTGINIFIDPDVHTKLSEDQLKVNLKVKDLLLKSALKLILQAKELSATYKDGVLIIQPKEKQSASLVTRIYDVRDLLLKIQDFPGPKVELSSPSSGGGALTGASFQLDEEPKTTITEDFMTELIKTNTGDKSWEDNPNASITLANGLLIVTQSRKVHEEVDRMLNLLRQFK